MSCAHAVQEKNISVAAASTNHRHRGIAGASRGQYANFLARMQDLEQNHRRQADFYPIGDYGRWIRV